MKQVSDRRLVERDIYNEKRDVFLAEHRFCQINLDGCNYNATEVHHRISRGVRIDLWINEANFVAACRSCHRYITDNPEFAYESGFSGHAWDAPDSPKIVPRPELAEVA